MKIEGDTFRARNGVTAQSIRKEDGSEWLVVDGPVRQPVRFELPVSIVEAALEDRELRVNATRSRK